MNTSFRQLRAKEQVFYILRVLYMSLCVLVALLPLLWVVMSSFKTNSQILSSGLSLPTGISFEGYRQALQISPIMQYFFNSIFITFASTVLTLFFYSMTAYIFARCHFKGKNLLYAVLLLSMVIPMVALLQPVYVVIRQLEMFDTMRGLILVYMALNMPMSLMVLRSAFAGIPRSMEEAAYADGAGFVRTFFQIMLPMAKGGIASAGILSFLNSWNEFTFALILTSSQRVRTLPLSLSYFTSQFSFNYTAMFAAITLVVGPSIVVFALCQEQVVTSLTAGAVKE